jgi:hypothetical protein
MSGQPRRLRLFAGALVTAVAVAGLVGFLVSRPPRPLTPAPLTTVATPIYPPATAGYSVADDPATQQVVAFGGIADNQATWIWNGSRWNLADPQTSPSGRIDAAAAYDPVLHLVLLFGGHGAPGTDLDDTWAWGGATWHELNKGTESPPPSDAVMAWDPALGQMLLVAGGPSGVSTGTWIWAGVRWTRLGSGLPFPASGISIGFDASSREMIAAALPASGDASPGGSIQTWSWNGSSWRDVTPADAPRANALLGLGWDPPGKRLLLFGTSAAGIHAPQIWMWDGAAWRQFSTDGATILGGVFVGTDTALLLVGTVDTGDGVPTSVRVWSWSADVWTPA